MARRAVDAVVVGSGPNGLCAAITLAQAGRSVRVLEGAETLGGGARSAELTLPGFVHDVCSAIHPLAVASPFFHELELDVEWVHPDAPAAHPFDDGTALVLERDLLECEQDPRRVRTVLRGADRDHQWAHPAMPGHL